VIRSVTGDLLRSDAEALVNTVNTVGVMGKGLALQFKLAFPVNYALYKKACDHGDVLPGKMFVVPMLDSSSPRYLINFPTKRHWRGKSRLEDISSGLVDLVEVIKRYNIRSIAVPPLGCSNGGLDWDDVRPLIIGALGPLTDVSVLLYTPGWSPDAETIQVETKQPNMTLGRAALICALQSYLLPGYRMTLLEIQKLAFFLQVAGQPLRLDFVKQRFGPYAENLNFVLQRIEGHFIRGYGDRSKGALVRVLPDGIEAARAVLDTSPETLSRLERVTQLIDGFETPYGMELLATVHWVLSESPGIAADPDAVVEAFHAWNERKRTTFRPSHIKLALARLASKGWVDGPSGGSSA
jgi:O-acetyl-ADP-ribose deacetylase (regulator of RNase III)